MHFKIYIKRQTKEESCNTIPNCPINNVFRDKFLSQVSTHW